jgi:hypothetical protein
MQRMFLSASLGVVLALGAAGSALAQSTSPMAPAMAKPMELVIKLATQNASAESGTATLTDSPDGLVVVVKAAGGNAAGPQPEHIHDGTCAKLGGVKYPLKPLVDGASTTTIPKVTIADLLAGTYAINLHKSTTEIAVYTACGDIVKPKM